MDCLENCMEEWGLPGVLERVALQKVEVLGGSSGAKYCSLPLSKVGTSLEVVTCSFKVFISQQLAPCLGDKRPAVILHTVNTCKVPE